MINRPLLLQTPYHKVFGALGHIGTTGFKFETNPEYLQGQRWAIPGREYQPGGGENHEL